MIIDGPMLERLQYRILKRLCPEAPPDAFAGNPFQEKGKLRTQLGDDFVGRIPGKTIIDFGCGNGVEAIELARLGARRVIGIDIREEVLEVARRAAAAAGVERVCHFACTSGEPADLIVSLDAFEHFEDPAEILRIMYGLLRPGGEVLVSFGPTWYHPLGGHGFSVFPWAHLVFSEKALLRWRSDFKTDGAQRFHEVAGGLNQMTIGRFERLVAESPLRLIDLEAVPIRKLQPLHNRWTREFTSAVVRCRLEKT